ncbi:MAG: hypothetical protein B7Y35_11225 [Sphingomonadales bacterium 28-64-96]|nr:MAG: hypothetical protein B7Y35_11225 [Sphingomonadales bacterium 28-64-96]
MNQVAHPQFAFGTACMAIGISPEQLRNWLTRKQVEVMGERTEGGHRRFSLADICVLSIVAELVQYGIGVKQAFEFTEDFRRPLALLQMYKSSPVVALLWELDGRYILAKPAAPGDWVAHNIRYMTTDAVEDFRQFADQLESCAVASILRVAVKAMRRALKVEAASNEDENNGSALQLQAIDDWLVKSSPRNKKLKQLMDESLIDWPADTE